MARAYAEFNTSYAGTGVIVSALRETTDTTVQAVGPDFDNVWANGQVDTYVAKIASLALPGGEN